MTEKSRCMDSFQRAAGGENAVTEVQVNGLRRATRTTRLVVGVDGISQPLFEMHMMVCNTWVAIR